MNKTEKIVFELTVPLALKCGVEIYDVEYIKEGADMVLRVFIDKDGGADINDCEKFSRELSDMLDKSDPIENKFMLEVSTPGIERKLSRPEHFEKYTGSEVTVHLFSPEHGKKLHVGILAEYEPDIILNIDDEKFVFNKKNISSVNLYYKF